MSEDKTFILVVEDEPVTRSMLVAYLEKEGFDVAEAENGDQMNAVLDQRMPALMFLDIQLPGQDGFSLAREVRARPGYSNMGIIMVTAKKDDVDRIVGLELGADDYVTKPFNPRELVARARNLLRRLSMVSSGGGPESVSFNGWNLNLIKRQLTDLQGNEIRLTRGEYDLLVAFVRNPGDTLSREHLLDLVSSREYSTNDRTIDVLISRLRRKMEEDPKAPRLFVTVHGAGYQFGGSIKN